jgi:hypothetical protein
VEFWKALVVASWRENRWERRFLRFLFLFPAFNYCSLINLTGKNDETMLGKAVVVRT